MTSPTMVPPKMLRQGPGAAGTIVPPRRGVSARLRVLLVDDSPQERHLLRTLIDAALDLDLVAVASGGMEALGLLAPSVPDIVCVDYQMPGMNGLEFVQRLTERADAPPVVVMSTASQSGRPDNLFRLLTAGASEVVAKPRARGPRIEAEDGRELLDALRRVARQPPRRRVTARASPAQAGLPIPCLVGEPAGQRAQAPGSEAGVELVVIGASTGGPQILQRVLGELPADLPVPVLVVQHISDGFLPGLLGWMQRHCSLRLCQARPGERPRAGEVAFAPHGHHLVLEASGRLGLQAATQRDVHVPGVDPLMLSAARHIGARCLGVLLSGMGRDGALGLKALRDAGAPTIAQDEATSVVFGMPAAAIALGAARQVLPLAAIAPRIVRLVRTQPRSVEAQATSGAQAPRW